MMKNLTTILFLLFAGALFAQPVRTTITDDGSNVTVQTPVNVKVIPICDFHWLFSDGNLQLWIDGRNELIPGGRLGNFTINGETTQASKLAALGAISDQCSTGGSGSGLDSLYYGTELLEDGDTIPVAAGNITVTQTSHGFQVGQPVRDSAGAWIGADASTPKPAQGVVIDSVSANVFTISFHGVQTITAHGFVRDTTYFTPSGAGLAVTYGNRPTNTQGLFTPISANQIIVHVGDMFLNQNPPDATITILTDTSANSRLQVYEIPINVNPAFNDSLSLTQVEGGSTFLMGTVAGGSTVKQYWNGGADGSFEIGNRYFKFSGGTDDIDNAQIRARLPTEYEGDTSKYFRVRIAYKSDDNGSAGTSNTTAIKVWQQESGGAYVQNNTVLSSNTNGVESTVEVVRKISSTTTRWITVLVNVDGDASAGNRDTIRISSVEIVLLDPAEKTIPYVAPVTIDLTPETIDTTVSTQYVLAKTGTRDFWTLEGAIDSIPAGSNGAWNKLYIKNGVYNFFQNHQDSLEFLPAFLRITGQRRDSVIINSDGTTEPGLLSSESTFNPKFSNIIENLTVYAKDVKYAIHPDFTGNAVSWFQNLRLIKQGDTDHIIGMGQRSNEWFHIVNCEFESRNTSTSAGNPIYWHNTASQSSPTELIITGCKSAGMGLLTLVDIMSTQPDIVRVTNCSSTSDDTGILIVTDYSNNTSNLNIIQENVNVRFYDYTDLYTDTIYLNANDFVVRVYNNTGSTLTKGTAIKKDYLNSVNTRQYVVASATDGWFDYITYKDIPTASFGWAIVKGKSALVTNVNAAYTKGNMLKVNSSGLFEVTATRSEATAISLQTTTTSSSLLKVKIL